MVLLGFQVAVCVFFFLFFFLGGGGGVKVTEVSGLCSGSGLNVFRCWDRVWALGSRV